jgi:adenylate cyclase
MIRLSIRRKIMGIAIALIVLMAVTAVMTVVLVMQVGTRIEQLTYSYMPAYGHLARANIRSLERALSIRRIIIEKIQSPVDNGQYAALHDQYEALGKQVELEILAARALIHELIEKDPTFGDVSTLSQFETRIDAINDDSRRRLTAEIQRLLAVLDSGDKKALAEEMERVDELRDELNRKLDSVRADMLALLRKDANMTVQKQHQVMLISVALTALAAILGLVFAALVSAGLARPVRRLLEGARAVEAGNLDGTLVATSQDEIGHLTIAFNRMVEQLRLKERLRETFGKYLDPRVVEGLIQAPALAAEGQRRVMTVLFCDVKGFSSTSEGMTPQGLVKVMNRYF